MTDHEAMMRQAIVEGAVSVLAEIRADLARVTAERDRAIGEREAAEETIDTLRGECGDDGHAPWCREWRKMVAERDRLASALAEVRRLRDEWAAVDPAEGWARGSPQYRLLTHDLAIADLAAAHDERTRAAGYAAGAMAERAHHEAAR